MELTKKIPNNTNTAIVIVTYNPDDLIDMRLKRHLDIANQVIVVDNGSDNDISKSIKIKYPSIDVIKSYENKGIAWALNQGINLALKNNKDFILTFDQDSLPSKDILKVYAAFLKNSERVGILGTSFSEKEKEIDIGKISFKDTRTIITSGALHNVEIFKTVGLYDESLFIDSVDFDFALRVNLKYKVYRCDFPLIKHKLGDPIRKYGVSSSNHNAWRDYYMTRNHVIITKRYWKYYPFWIFKLNFFFLIDFFKMILIEKDRSEKFQAQYKGLKDGLNYKSI